MRGRQVEPRRRALVQRSGSAPLPRCPSQRDAQLLIGHQPLPVGVGLSDRTTWLVVRQETSHSTARIAKVRTTTALTDAR